MAKALRDCGIRLQPRYFSAFYAASGSEENVLQGFFIGLVRLERGGNITVKTMDELFMKRALELAERGAGFTSPNPMVGAVIVRDGRIIGEGWHERFGGPHAEINALMRASESVEGADMYVTLEPCSHFGKTPPCAVELVRRNLKRVVVAMEDPNPLVAGRGLAVLREGGILVETGMLEQQARRLNEVFIKYMTTRRPFCVLKTAMTLDGKIATRTGDSKWITNELSRAYVHQLRHRLSAIMAGAGTILADDPQLTARLVEGEGKDPVRVIVDSSARIPLSARVLHLESKAPTLIAVTQKADPAKIAQLRELGAEVLLLPEKEGRVDLSALMEALGQRGIDSVLLEGGSTLSDAALREGIIDKVMVFIAPKMVGGAAAPTPVGGLGAARISEAALFEDMTLDRFGEDILITAYVKRRD